MDSETSKVKIEKIAIAGAGGIGGYVSAALFNYGAQRNQFPFGNITIDIYDDDIVDTSNLLHQNYTDEDVGKYKVDICAERCEGLINPVKKFLTKKDLSGYDVVFSCVDSMTFRKDLYNYGWEHPELFWIDGRCSSRHIGLYHSKLSRKSIEGDLTDSTERAGCLLAVDKKNKTSHVTPQIIAGMMVQTFLNYYRGELQTDKLVLMI